MRGVERLLIALGDPLLRCSISSSSRPSACHPQENRRPVQGQFLLFGTIGKGPGGICDAHLHFEMRKDLRFGMRARMFPLIVETYLRPEVFIKANRNFWMESRLVKVPIHTFMKSNPNRVISEPIDLTDVIPSRDETVRPAMAARLEEVIEEETNTDEVTPEKTRSVFGAIFG